MDCPFCRDGAVMVTDRVFRFPAAFVALGWVLLLWALIATAVLAVAIAALVKPADQGQAYLGAAGNCILSLLLAFGLISRLSVKLCQGCRCYIPISK